jgi:hypothetical protein
MDINDIMRFAIGRLLQGWTLQELDEAISAKVKLDSYERKRETDPVEYIQCLPVTYQELNSVLNRLRKK